MYFIGKLFKLSENDDFDVEHLGTEADIGENDLLLDIITNLQACKSFHNNLQNSVVDNLHEMITSFLMEFRETMDRDIKLNGWS